MSKEATQYGLDAREFVEAPVEVRVDNDGVEDNIQQEAVESKEAEVELSPRDQIANDYQDREHEEAAEEELPDEIEVKIDGSTKMVSREKVEGAGGIEAYQKRASADRALQEASLQRKRANEEWERVQAAKRELQQQREQLKKSPPPAGEAAKLNPPEGGSKDSELAQQYHDALFDGDSEKANELLLKINGGTQQATPAVDPDKIVQQVTANLQQQQERQQKATAKRNYDESLLKGVSSFNEDYPDIAGDPMLSGLVDSETVRLQKENPDWMPEKIIKEAASGVQKRFVDKGDVSSSNVSKMDRKRKTSTPRAASGKVSKKTTPAPESNKDYVQRLQKERGMG